MKFGEMIKTRRAFRRLTLDKLSTITGYNISTLNDFESSRSIPVTFKDIPKGTLKNNDIDTFNGYLKFCRLADALGFDLRELESSIRQMSIIKS